MKRCNKNSQRNYFNLLFILFLLFASSCGQKKITKTTDSGKTIDKRLVGIWEGSESNAQMEGMTKEWIMTREGDGSFSLDFTYKMNGESMKTIEEGTWWVEDGLFYELHESSGLTDIYYYKVLDENQIKFTAKKVSFLQEGVKYEFIDRRSNTNTSE